MKRAIVIAGFVAVAAASYFAGRHSAPGAPTNTSSRRILYYVDPMHPSYRSDHPGTAPDCGMALEPVYEGSAAPERPLPASAVAISGAKQQLLGVRVEQVERSAGTRLVRTTGRVALDENQLYRILAATDGWIRTLRNNAAGTVVHKNELLATFYSNDFLRSQQTFFFALKTLDRLKANSKESDEQIKQAEDQVRTGEEELRSLGMGEPQIKEIRKTREITREVSIASPIDGIIVTRNLSPNQRLERGVELYRIANLDHVWILADLFPGSSAPPAGTKVRVTIRELSKTIYATVGPNLPLFDPASRVLKLRLEAENPGYLLRPDMFVDVEFTAKVPPGISIPAGAVLDSGMHKVVYVETADGVFEPRTVETGASFGDRVEVRRGLMEGERVVTAGNFMIDSESRMRTPVQQAAASTATQHSAAGIGSATDPVCGMKLSAEDLKAAHHSTNYQGRKLVFCSAQCKNDFEQNPEKYAANRSPSAGGSGAH